MAQLEVPWEVRWTRPGANQVPGELKIGTRIILVGDLGLGRTEVDLVRSLTQDNGHAAGGSSLVGSINSILRRVVSECR